MYVIKKQGSKPQYVSPDGSHKAYTNCICKAKKFSSKDAAQADCCGNEYPVQISRY